MKKLALVVVLLALSACTGTREPSAAKEFAPTITCLASSPFPSWSAPAANKFARF